MKYSHFQTTTQKVSVPDFLIVVVTPNDLDTTQARFEFSVGGIVTKAEFDGKFKNVVEIDNDVYVYKIIAGDGVTPDSFAYCKTTDNTPLTDDYLIKKFVKK